MAGLLAYAAAGGIEALGRSLAANSEARRAAAMDALEREREDALRKEERDLRKSERLEDRQWDVEDRDFNARERRSLAAMSRRGRGGGSAAAGYKLMTPEEKRAAGLPEEVGYQQNTKTGQITAIGGTTGKRDDEGGEEFNQTRIRTALNSNDIPYGPDTVEMIEAEMDASGDDLETVISRLDIDEEVTNKGGTAVSRLTYGLGNMIGLTDEDPSEWAPDEVQPTRPKGFKDAAGLTDTVADNTSDATSEMAEEAMTSTSDGPSGEPPTLEEPDALAAPGVNIPQSAIDELLANPTEEMMAYFDEAFGPGSAASVLGQ